MARINIIGIDDNTGAPKVIGWFNPAKCESWSPGTHWNGSDNVLNTSGPDTASDTLYRTPGGRWIRETRSRWVGTTDQYRYLTDDEAPRVGRGQCGGRDAHGGSSVRRSG